MARSTRAAAARSAERAADRLEEIQREIAAILKTFPDLRLRDARRRTRGIFWSEARRRQNPRTAIIVRPH